MPPSRQIDKVDLFLSTDPNKFSYKGLCKVYIDLGPKLLVVKNDYADTPIIEIPFYYPFMMHQNILCHISPTKLHDIVLIFSTDKICNEVYNIVHNYQAKINHETAEDSNKVVILSDRILNPLSLAISSDPNLSRSTKSRILQMVQPITSRENDKKVVIKSELSEHPTALPYSPAGPSTITINMPAAGSNISSPSIRKRKKQTQSSSSAVTVSPNKRCKTEVFDEDITPEATTITDTNNVFTKRFLNSTEYEIQTFYEKSIKKQKLIVYCTADKKLCYSYFYERKSKRFVCEKCKEQNRYVIAYLREQQYDSQFVELGLLPHLCNPIPYSPPPTTFYVHGNTDSNNQSLPGTSAINGLDLIPSSSLTSARNNTVTKTSATLRHLKKVNTKIVRKISEVFNNVTKEGNSGTPDSSSTLNQTPEILKPPQYQIHSFPSGSKHKQRLIVFYPYNQNYCFPYSYEVTNRRFICIRCKKNRRLVVAYVKYDSNGDEYLELGPLYHLCPPLSVENYPAPLNTNDEFNGSSNILPLEMSVINSDNLTLDLDNNSFVAYDSVELKGINLLEESKAGDKVVKQGESVEVLKDVKQEENDQYLKSELSEGPPTSLADQEVSNASNMVFFIIMM
uniref:Uncharacterized protein n=1 Tax=Panagrolaimus davidi TaxID=227884 RepID=A0A914PR34_9BILA